MVHYVTLALCLSTTLASAGEVPSGPAATFHGGAGPLAAGAVTEDWPDFLGPRRDSVCRETKLLVLWPKEGPRLVWEMSKGTGYSSPSIAGDRLVFFHRLNDQEVIECLNAETGKRHLQVSYGTQYRDRFGYSNGPRATPVIHEGRVYTLGAAGMLSCTDIESGQFLWQRDVARDFDLRQGFFGVGATPLIEGKLLIVNVGAPSAGAGACVVAFDKDTGKTVWQCGDQWGASYASPVAALVHGKRRVFVFTGGDSRPPVGGLLCIDPTDGRIDFRFPWRSRSYESVNASNPLVVDNQAFVTASYQTGGAMLAIEPDLKCRSLWTTDELGSHFGTPIHVDGHLYGVDGRHTEEAALVCVEVKTGRTVWRYEPQWEEQYEAYGQKRRASFGVGRGALLRCGDKFLCLGEIGHLMWLDLSPQNHRIVSKAWLFAAPDSWTPPVVSRGLLYVAQNKRDFASQAPPRLMCYDLRGGE